VSALTRQTKSGPHTLLSSASCPQAGSRACGGVLAAIAISACFHSSAALRPAHRINYWEALAELHPDDAVEAARTPSEKAFAQSLRNLMEGDFGKGGAGIRAAAPHGERFHHSCRFEGDLYSHPPVSGKVGGARRAS